MGTLSKVTWTTRLASEAVSAVIANMATNPRKLCRRRRGGTRPAPTSGTEMQPVWDKDILYLTQPATRARGTSLYSMPEHLGSVVPFGKVQADGLVECLLQGNPNRENPVVSRWESEWWRFGIRGPIDRDVYRM